MAGLGVRAVVAEGVELSSASLAGRSDRQDPPWRKNTAWAVVLGRREAAGFRRA